MNSPRADKNLEITNLDQRQPWLALAQKFRITTIIAACTITHWRGSTSLIPNRVPKKKKTEAEAPPLDADSVGKGAIERRGEVDERDATITKRSEVDRWNGETSKIVKARERTTHAKRHETCSGPLRAQD